MYSAREPCDIERFFRGLTEYAFHSRLGVVDPPLVEYMSLLLVRFLRHDHPSGPPGTIREEITQVARALVEARDRSSADEAREGFRRIGDATLFWSGIYPEALRRFRDAEQGVSLVAYREAGKRAYWMASTLEPEEALVERLLLERLSCEFDLCVEGLAEVRRAWSEAA